MPDNEPIIPKYMNLYKRIEYNGHHIDIYYDESPESPRAWDNLGTFYTIHHRYCPEEEFDRHFQWEEVFDRYGDFSDSFEKQYIALKIYLYDHSGQTISSSPFFYPWDSGLFGIVAVSVEKVKKEYDWKLLTAERRQQIGRTRFTGDATVAVFRHFQPTGRGDKRTGGRNIDTVAAVTASTDDISKQIIRARERRCVFQ